MERNTILFLVIGFVIISVGIFYFGFSIGSNNRQESIYRQLTNSNEDVSLVSNIFNQTLENTIKSTVYPEVNKQEQVKENSNQQTSFDNRDCIGTGPVNFTYSPVKIEDLNILQPMGLMVGAHVTPIDHQYYYTSTWKRDYALEDLKGVYAPADGIIFDIELMQNHAELSSDKRLSNYRFYIYHSCTFYTIFINVYQLTPKLLAGVRIDNGPVKPIHVKAGELLGGSVGIDFSANNVESFLKGFIVPEHYSGESWKIHTVDPFDYFVEPVKSQLLAKNVRQVSPRGGKIDYDVDGKLIGNWFIEHSEKYQQTNRQDYWKSHLAIVPDALDPSHIIFSIGNFNGEPKQFGVKGNAPNPVSVRVETGLIKYELTSYYYLDAEGNSWDNLHYTNHVTVKNNDDQVYGTVLLQLIDKRRLKLEVFPNKTSSQVINFTGNEIIYER